MGYVDGYILAVPMTLKDRYRAMTEAVGPLFMKHGATGMCECWADDVPIGERTSFPRAVECREDETIVFAWITWPDKATRDAGNQAALADAEAMGMRAEDNPVDGARMIFGGFVPFFEA